MGKLMATLMFWLWKQMHFLYCILLDGGLMSQSSCTALPIVFLAFITTMVIFTRSTPPGRWETVSAIRRRSTYLSLQTASLKNEHSCSTAVGQKANHGDSTGALILAGNGKAGCWPKLEFHGPEFLVSPEISACDSCGALPFQRTSNSRVLLLQCIPTKVFLVLFSLTMMYGRKNPAEEGA